MRVFKSANAHGVNADKQRVYGDRCVTDPTMFRVSPVMTTSIRLHVCQTRLKHSEPQKWGKTKMLEKRVRTTNYLVFWTRQNPWKQGKTGGRKSLSYREFRTSPIITAPKPLRIRVFRYADYSIKKIRVCQDYFVLGTKNYRMIFLLPLWLFKALYTDFTKVR